MECEAWRKYNSTVSSTDIKRRRLLLSLMEIFLILILHSKRHTLPETTSDKVEFHRLQHKFQLKETVNCYQKLDLAWPSHHFLNQCLLFNVLHNDVYIYTKISYSFNYQNERIQRSTVCCWRGKSPHTFNEKLWKTEELSWSITRGISTCTYMITEK